MHCPVHKWKTLDLLIMGYEQIHDTCLCNIYFLHTQKHLTAIPLTIKWFERHSRVEEVEQSIESINSCHNVILRNILEQHFKETGMWKCLYHYQEQPFNVCSFILKRKIYVYLEVFWNPSLHNDTFDTFPSITTNFAHPWQLKTCFSLIQFWKNILFTLFGTRYLDRGSKTGVCHFIKAKGIFLAHRDPK